MRYLSLFSGIGGLECADAEPVLCCELDPAARRVLARRFPGAILHPDVRTLEAPPAEVVVGGWPCQDISVAGLQRGLAGEKSGLFFRLLDLAAAAGAHTIVAENVPNLLHLEEGKAFREVLRSLGHHGYPFVAWRVLNARRFGLPHQRERVFLVASRHREIAVALHRELPAPPASSRADGTDVAGFYWTAGLQSICYSRGYVPTLKVGSSLSIPSPPALHFDGLVRKATPAECLAFQGFTAPGAPLPACFDGIAAKDLYRMSGNAVARPVGAWVMASLDAAGSGPTELPRRGGGRDLASLKATTRQAGFWADGHLEVVPDPFPPESLARNLSAFVDRREPARLSPRASAGLRKRLASVGRWEATDPGLRALLDAYADAGVEPAAAVG